MVAEDEEREKNPPDWNDWSRIDNNYYPLFSLTFKDARGRASSATNGLIYQQTCCTQINGRKEIQISKAHGEESDGCCGGVRTMSWSKRDICVWKLRPIAMKCVVGSQMLSWLCVDNLVWAAAGPAQWWSFRALRCETLWSIAGLSHSYYDVCTRRKEKNEFLASRELPSGLARASEDSIKSNWFTQPEREMLWCWREMSWWRMFFTKCAVKNFRSPHNISSGGNWFFSSLTHHGRPRSWWGNSTWWLGTVKLVRVCCNHHQLFKMDNQDVVGP